MDTMIAFALPEMQTTLTILAAVALGGFTVVLAWSCQNHDLPGDD